METKLNKDTAEKVCDQCNFHFSWVVPSEGKSGGLALFWREGLSVEVLDFDQSYIDTVVKGGVLSDWWHFTGFYGSPDTSRRDESWALLKRIRDRSSLLWLCIGDFNEIVCESEKEGGSSRLSRHMKNFSDTKNWCGLKDVGHVGSSFPWLYQRADGFQIRKRLDHALASLEWERRFQDARLYHLTCSALDHSLLSLHFFRKPLR